MNPRVYHKITYFTALVTLSAVTFYALIRFKLRFLLSGSKGDETGFVESFQYFKANGFSASVEQGTSILFDFFAWIVGLFGASDLMTLRITSFIFGLGTLFVASYLAKKFFTLSKLYYLVFVITGFNILVISSVYLSGINDTLVFFLISLLFYRLYTIWKDGYTFFKDSLILGVLIGCLLLTRMMTVLYFIPIAFVLWLIFRKQKQSFVNQLKIGIATVFIALLVIALPNVPSLTKGKGLSSHVKKLDDTIDWPQLQYLTALESNKGNITYGKHVSIEQVKAYLKENGEDALPKTLSETISFDIGFTIKEFFKDFALQAQPITRLSGLSLFFLLLALILNRKQLFKLTLSKLTLLFAILFIAILCFIAINYVEPRWYVGVLILLSISIFQLLQDALEKSKFKEQGSFVLLNLHMLLLIAMNGSYILNNYQQLV